MVTTTVDAAGPRRRRFVSATYEGGGRACKQHIDDCALAVYDDENPATEDVARLVASLQQLADPSAFFVMDASAVEARAVEWRQTLPFTRPFYAMQCNDDPLLLQMLTKAHDFSLMASSAAELERALAVVPASRVLFNSPLVTRKTLRLLGSLEQPVAAIVLDSEEALLEAADCAPFQPLLLRVSLSPESERVDLALGMPIDEAIEAVPRLLSERVPLVGLSVQLQGEGDTDVVRRAEALICLLRELAGCGLEWLDVGGGFRSGQLATPACLLQFIAANSGWQSVKLLATPGRFFAASAFSLVTNIVAKRAVDASALTCDEAECCALGYVYQTNESFYGAFGGQLLGEQPQCTPLGYGEWPVGGQHPSAVLGTALDQFDFPQRHAHLPAMAVGDWLLWKEMGAYSTRDEDGVPVYYFTGRSHWERLAGMKEPPSMNESDDSGLLSDGASDGETEADEDDMTECFGRVFTD